MKSEEKKKTETPEASTTPSIEEQSPKSQALEGLWEQVFAPPPIPADAQSQPLTSVTTPSTALPASLPVEPPVPVAIIPFKPIKRKEDDLKHKPPPEKVYRRRMFLFGFLSAFLLGIDYFFLENPFNWQGWVYEQFGILIHITLSWSGLFVYSSIAALIIFLCLLLLRYFSMMNLAYLHTARHTAQAKDQQQNHSFTPPVSIIVPAYNEGKLIQDTIRSLLSLNYPKYEIIVVNDGSTDDTLAQALHMVGDYGKAVVKVVDKPNGGKATALNAGIQISSYEFVLCVDGDSLLAPDSLRFAIRHFEDPRLGAVAGNVKVLNRDNLWTRLQALEYIEGLNIVRAAQSSARLVNIIPGPFGLFRKQAIIDAGWYSSDTYAEDCDITLKIIRMGWHVEYEPLSIAWVESPNKLLDLLKQRYRWTRGILQALMKHKRLFLDPTINFGATLVMWSMAFEALIWPAMNVFANFYFISVALLFGLHYFLVYWWLSLTLLDMVAALYCIAAEKENISLVFYAVIYRLFFVLLIDVCKTFATIEEFLGLGMTWGKLERIGVTKQVSAVPA